MSTRRIVRLAFSKFHVGQHVVVLNECTEDYRGIVKERVSRIDGKPVPGVVVEVRREGRLDLTADRWYLVRVPDEKVREAPVRAGAPKLRQGLMAWMGQP